MEYSDLVKDACATHMLFAKEIYRVIENFLRRGENRILLWIWQQKKTCAADVIAHFGLSAGRVSNILKALEAKGYLLRERSEWDHRVAYIVLTEKGEAQANAIYENLHVVFQRFFSQIGEEDARYFLNFEKKIMQLIQDGTLTLEG